VIKNIFQLMKVVSPEETLRHFEELYNTMKIRYGDMKKQLAEDMIVFTDPLREKISEISKNDDLIRKVIKTGREKAKESALHTITMSREAIGILPF
jgi:tryptophanyl-tRNA synthetase